MSVPFGARPVELDVGLLRALPDDRVVLAEQFAEVDVGLGHLDVAGRRQVPGGEVGQPAGRLVGRRGDEPVAVGVDEVLVDPVGLVAGELRRVELAGADDVVLRLAVDGVAVDVELVVEAVVVEDPLPLVERRSEDVGVEQPGIGDRAGVVLDLLLFDRSDVGRGVVRAVVDLGDPVRRPGRLDVALDVRLFLLVRVGLDLELLDDRRVGAADQHAGEHQQDERDGREGEVAEEHVGEERDRADQRHRQQNRLGRQHGVDVGVGRPGDPAAVGEHQAVAVEVVGKHLEHDQPAQQDREVGPRRRSGLVPRRLDPQSAEEVVHDHRGDQRQQERDEEVAEDEALERIGEGVVGQVLVELRILDAERRAVLPEQPRLPPALCREAGEEGEDDAYGDDDLSRRGSITERYRSRLCCSADIGRNGGRVR